MVIEYAHYSPSEVIRLNFVKKKLTVEIELSVDIIFICFIQDFFNCSRNIYTNFVVYSDLKKTFERSKRPNQWAICKLGLGILN